MENNATIIKFGQNQTFKCQSTICWYFSENFPNPYSQTTRQTDVLLTADEGKGLTVLFTEFLMGNDDSFTICESVNKNCETKFGSDFKFRRNHAFYKSNGSIYILIKTSTTNTTTKHAGFSFLTKSFDEFFTKMFVCTCFVREAILAFWKI